MYDKAVTDYTWWNGQKRHNNYMISVLKENLAQRRESGGLVGPFGIVAMVYKSLDYGFAYYFLNLAILSINKNKTSQTYCETTNIDNGIIPVFENISYRYF